MGNSSVDHLNGIYSALEYLDRGRPPLPLYVLDGDSSGRIAAAVRESLQDKEAWEVPPVEDLSMLLKVAYNDAKSFVANEQLAHEHWASTRDSIHGELDAIQGYLPTSVVETIRNLSESLPEWGPAASLELEAGLDAQIHSVDGQVALASETTRLHRHLEQWAAQHPEASRLFPLPRARLSSELKPPADLLVFIGNPRSFVGRAGGENYFRALCFGGFAFEIRFIAPRWACHKSDTKVFEGIFPIQQEEKTATVAPISSRNQPVDISSDTPPDNFEKFVVAAPHVTTVQSLRRGSVPCRLIMVSSGYVFPVEEDSSRVATLHVNALTGSWEPESKNPFNELESGDLLLAKLDSSENEDLRQRAALALGKDFDLLEASQENWKALLNSQMTLHPHNVLVGLLKGAGVSAAHRHPHWIQPEFISPQSDDDFAHLLAYLGITEAERIVTMKLAKAFKAALIAEGLRPGKEISDLLNEQEMTEQDFATGRAVVLENLGNARYLIAPVLGIDDEPTLCDPNQVRTLVSRASQ